MDLRLIKKHLFAENIQLINHLDISTTFNSYSCVDFREFMYQYSMPQVQNTSKLAIYGYMLRLL